MTNRALIDSPLLLAADVVATTDPAFGAEREDVLTELVLSSQMARLCSGYTLSTPPNPGVGVDQSTEHPLRVPSRDMCLLPRTTDHRAEALRATA